MHWLDLVLLALLTLGAGLGFWSGFVMQVARLLSLVVSGYATFVLNEPITRLLHERVAPEASLGLLHGIAYVLVFLVVYITLFALSRLLYRVVRASKLELLDRFAGGLLGAVKIALFLAPVCAFLAFLELPATEQWMSRSTIAPVLAKGMDSAMTLLPDSYRNQAHDSAEQVRERLQHEAVNQAVDLIKIEDALKK